MSTPITQRCKQIVESDTFESWIVTLIIVNALFLGAETNPILSENYDGFIWAVLWGSQFIFVAEITLRFCACGLRPKEFFRDFWNSFDFIVVAASFLPAVGPFATVARVLRVLRVLRIMTVSDELRLFLDQLRKSSRIFIYGGIVWAIFAYVYAIAGFYLFADADPNSWSELSVCIRTVFTLSLFQDVPAVLTPLWENSRLSIFYFLAFYSGLVLLIANIFAHVQVQSASTERTS